MARVLQNWNGGLIFCRPETGSNSMNAKKQVITIAYLISIWPYRPTFLDFPALPEFNPRVHRKDVLFDPPPGPGGRRPTPDSAMRPRARKCLVWCHHPRRRVIQ